MIWALIAVVILDIISTNAVLKRGGVEANPVTRWIMRKMGTLWPAGRAIPTLAAGAGLVYTGSADWGWLVVGVTGLVVLNNVRIWRELK